MLFRGVLCFIAILLTCLPGLDAQARDNPLAPIAIPVKAGAPRGFEFLDEPQIGKVDVSYGGRMIGSAMVTYTSETVAFENINELLNTIPAIKPDALDKIVTTLSGKISNHAENICSRYSGNFSKNDCGTLTPDVAGVIFDESHFKAELFINSTLLDKQDSKNDRILPPAENIFSGLHSFSGNVSKEPDGRDSFSMIQNSTLGYGQGRFNLVNVYTQDTQRMDSALLSLDKKGYLFKAGYFESLAHHILPELQVTGVSAATSLDTNLAQKRNAGNQIWLFLPTRSWVTLLHNNIIYATEFYEAGNQIIDTTALPEGAYDITIRIREPNGNTRDEKRFFAKNFQIPPPGQPIYYTMAGFVRQQDQTQPLPQTSSTPIFQADTIRRITDNIGVNASLMDVGDTGYIELGTFCFLNQIKK
ncbi:MAG: TcfC E-set like domain-containing protein [Alphaproteobacteria bacterium]|nr:TcfC E-set like domain-containing protein [Alphaproteobacteria bacterium]